MRKKTVDKPDLVLKGHSANNISRSEGIAFIAMSPKEARERVLTFNDAKSMILVCPELDWSWSDVANHVAGVVADHGTRVSRGSEVSGIVQVPAVLGTKDATNKVTEGDFVIIICEGVEALAKIYKRR